MTMSSVIGVKVVSDNINWVALDGTRKAPQYVEHGRDKFPGYEETAEVLDWAETLFGNLLDRQRPDQIAYKLSRPLIRNEQIFRIYFTLGVLNLSAFRRKVFITHISEPGMRHTAFGLSKGSDIRQHMTDVLGHHGQYWNGDMLEAAAVAYLRLP